MIKNVLITGGAGFIGSNLSLQLIKKGYNITVLDNLSRQIHGENPQDSFLYNSIKDKVNFIQGDILERADLERAIEGQDAIVHLAAETGTGQSMYQIYRYSDVNISGTALLLDILANTKHTVQKLVVASSRAIYGEGRYHCAIHNEVYPLSRNKKDLEEGRFECTCPICGGAVELLPTHEDSKHSALSIYGISKYSQEQLCLVAGKALNIPTVVFRYQNVYGPGQSLSNPYTGILSVFSTQIKNNNNLNIFEDGKESRDFVYIDDVVNATIVGLENDKANFNIYNVGTGTPTNVLEIAQLLISLYQSDNQINITGNFRLGDIRHNYADLTKITQDLGFKPQFTFKEGVTKFVNWVNGQKINKDTFEKSVTELKERGLFKG